MIVYSTPSFELYTLYFNHRKVRRSSAVDYVYAIIDVINVADASDTKDNCIQMETF